MNIFISKLDRSRFGIEVKPEDKVADVKKNIETVKGANVYPAANQILVHQGKVLEDSTTLEEYSIAENNVIIIMVRTPRTRDTQAPQPPPATMTPSENIFGQAESHLIEKISLDSGIPEQGGLPASASTQPVVPPNGSDLLRICHAISNITVRISQGFPTFARAGSNVDFLRNSQHFQIFRDMVLANPLTLPTMFNEVRNNNLQLITFISENKRDVGRLILEPLQNREHPIWQSSSELRDSRTLINRDLFAIRRLQETGFNILIVTEAYFACNKNENQAANFLWNLRRGFAD